MAPRVEHRFYNGIEQKFCESAGCRDLEAGVTGRWKSLNQFGKESRSWDGLKKSCKQCKNTAERRRYAKNPKKMSEDELLASKQARYDKTKEINGIRHKVCGDCKQWVSIDNFSTNGKVSVVTGEKTTRYNCNECRNKKRRERNAKKAENKKQEKEKREQKHIEKHNPPPKKLTRGRKVHRDENGNIIVSNIHKTIDGIEMKFCTGHEVWETLDSFGKRKGTRDGLNLSCKRYFREEYNRKKCKHGKIYKLCFECYPKEYKLYYEKLKQKRNDNPKYKLKENLRHRMWSALNGTLKSETTMNLIGCSIEELWDHLEAHFEDGMTRENYGSYWSIDHIKPCDLFDLTDERQQRQCFNWRNLQPLTTSENSSKNNNYDPEDFQHERFLEQIP